MTPNQQLAKAIKNLKKVTEVDREIRLLHKAVDDFAMLMKMRLAKKAREGFTGWDNCLDVSKAALAEHIAGKTDTILQHVYFRKSLRLKDIIDLANYAMMMELRRKSDKDKS